MIILVNLYKVVGIIFLFVLSAAYSQVGNHLLQETTLSPNPNILFQTVQYTSSSPTAAQSQQQHTFSQALSKASNGQIFWYFTGYIVGAILFISSLPCIWYKEKETVITARRIDLASYICQNADQSATQIREQKLVYIRGLAETNDQISDKLCGVSQRNLMKISREVEVLQWRRKVKKQRGTQKISIQKEWVSSNSPNQGDKFNDPARWFMQKQVIYNTKVYLKDYNLNQQIINLSRNCHYINTNRQIIDIINKNFNLQGYNAQIRDHHIYFIPTANEQYVPPLLQHIQQLLARPPVIQKIGTLRLKFEVYPTGQLSLVAKLSAGPSGKMLSSFNIAGYEGKKQQDSQLPCSYLCCFCNCYKSCFTPLQEILIVRNLTRSKQQLFDEMRQQSNKWAKITRIMASIIMFLGIWIFLCSFGTMLNYLPLVGKFAKGDTKLSIIIGALLLFAPVYMIAFSLAWTKFHESGGRITLILGGLILIFYYIFGRAQQTA